MSSKCGSIIIIMLVDFSYHPQTHDWGWISFYLKEENAWDNILELTKVDFFLDFFILKYCISRDVMQFNSFFLRFCLCIFESDAVKSDNFLSRFLGK